MLYETIEKLDSAIVKINYILKSHKAYTHELLEDVSGCPSEIIQTISGIECVNNDMIKELRAVSDAFNEILKGEKN